MSNYQKNSGFTIIEVMIVLAIAGVIMLITFEAIPSLTRSSRNNQRKQDATAILQAVSGWELNHSGDFPSSCGGSNPACKGGVGTVLYYAKMTYYDPTNTNQVIINAQTEATASATIPAEMNINVVKVYDYEKCVEGVQNTATNQGADYSNTVVMWAAETATGSRGLCQQL